MQKCRLFILYLLVAALILLQTTSPLLASEAGQVPAQEPGQGDFDPAGNRTGGSAQHALAIPSVAERSAAATKILCYSTRTGTSDPCARVGRIFTNVTLVRTTAEIPTDLAPYDVFYLGYGEGATLDSFSDTFVSYVTQGGGFVVEQPNLSGTVNVYPPGFEMTVADIIWPGFPNAPGPVEFTAAGAAHPVLNGLTPTDISGNFDNVPLSQLGPGWTVLAKSVAFPQIALAVGSYGAGRLVFHSGNIADSSSDQGSDTYVRQMIEWAGAGSTPGQNMRVDAIEVTQAIQDLNNSVDLVANKRTYVRVHVSSPANVANVFANLSGQRGSVTLYPTLSPGNPGSDITVRTSPNRGLINDSYWFELPNAWTNAGSLTLTARLDPADAKNDPDRSNNTMSVTVNFLTTPPLRLRIFDVRYSAGGTTYLAANLHSNLLESWLRRVYPISSLQVTRQTFDYPTTGLPDVDTLHGWLALGKLLRVLFSGEDARTVYYGMVDDGGGFMRGKALDIPSAIAAGPTGSDTFGWDTDGSYGDWYGGHEIAHTRNRYHAEFCGAGAGQPYPYPDGRISQDLNGATAFFGFDVQTRTIYNPSSWRDVMTYCTNQWISDFTYEGIRNYLVSVGVAQVQAAEGLVEADQFLVVMGMADLEANTADLESVYLLDQSQVVPAPSPGDWTMALQNASGEDLELYSFAPMELSDNEDAVGRPAVIALVVPAVDGLAGIEIRVNGKVVSSRTASVHPPVVEITSPALALNSAQMQEVLEVAWTATDQDNDPLSFSVLYSYDNGNTWQTLATGLTTNSYAITTTLVPGSDSSLVRVLASDGFLGAQATSAPFSVPLHAPQVEIISPSSGATFWPGQSVVLAGSAYDMEDATLSGSALVWSSSRDGFLGTGTLSDTVNLSTGNHVIGLTATDSDGMQTVAQISIAVVDGAAAEPVLLEASQNVLSDVVFPGDAAETLDVALSSSDDSALNWQATADEPWIKLSTVAGTLPAQLKVTIDSAGLSTGNYSGMINLQAAGASNTPLQIPVVLAVVAPPELTYTPATLVHTALVNGVAATFDIDLGSSEKATLSWQASTDAAWISLQQSLGVVPSKLSVTLDPAGLSPGVYNALVSISAAPAGNSPVAIPVTLTVEPRNLYLPSIRLDR